MTRLKEPCSTIAFLNDDDKNLEFLFEAFGSKVSPDDMATAYCQAGYNLDKACEILYNMLGSSSNNDTHISTNLTSAPASSVGVSAGTVSGVNGADYAMSRFSISKPQQVLSRTKPRNSGISVGTVSGLIGADYGRLRASTNETREVTKPVKLMSNEFPVSQIWNEQPQAVSATSETMNKDVELFLLKMLGDGFQLDMEVIKEVVGGCGFDVRESMEKLMNMSTPTLDAGDVNSNTIDQTFIETYQDLGSKFEEKLQFNDSPQRDRSNLEKEVLTTLFSAPERCEHGTETTPPRREPRTRKYGVVTGPLEDCIINFTTPIVKKEVNGNANEEIEDNYETLREAAMEHWITMKKYYRAAADAYAKGSYELADKLVKEGHFYMAKAREANETSGKMLTETRDDGEAISINLNDYDPKDAVRLLKTQLISMCGIHSIHYLKVVVGANDDKNKPNARKRLITKLLGRDSITWTEEEDGQIMSIRIDVINPKRLSFNKK